jgi:lysozyme
VRKPIDGMPPPFCTAAATFNYLMTDHDRLALISQLIRHESIKAKPYIDSLGYLTIGVGYNLTARGYGPLSETLERTVTLQDLRLQGLTQDECLAQLDADIDECIRDLATFPWFVRLDPVRQRVCVDMRFCLGPSKFRQFKKMIAALRKQDYATAADEIVDSEFYRQTKSRGVRLARWMRTGSDLEPFRETEKKTS